MVCCEHACMHAQSLQSCPTLWDPIDSGSPPGSSDPGILQARILEWVAISFSSCEHGLQLKTFFRCSKQEAEFREGQEALSRMASLGWEPGAREAGAHQDGGRWVMDSQKLLGLTAFFSQKVSVIWGLKGPMSGKGRTWSQLLLPTASALHLFSHRGMLS